MLDERSTLLMKGYDPTVIHLQDRRVTMLTAPPKRTADKHRLAISAPGTQHREETFQFLWHSFIPAAGKETDAHAPAGAPAAATAPLVSHRRELRSSGQYAFKAFTQRQVLRHGIDLTVCSGPDLTEARFRSDPEPASHR